MMISGFKSKYSQLLLLFVAFVVVVGFFTYKTPQKVEKTPVDVLFIGDSITYGWNFHPNVLPAHFGDSIAVQGVGGIDTLDLHAMLSSTQVFRSRQSIPWYAGDAVSKTPHGCMHLALKSYQPRVVVLEIGVNNWFHALIAGGEERVKSYRASRNYKKASVEDVQRDAAIGSINKRGVYQIVMQLREMYGGDTPIILVGGFPIYFLPDSIQFNTLLKEFSEDKESPVSAHTTYLDSTPIAQIGWSEEHGMFFDHESFPAEKEQFDSIHVDWGHLNKKGYDVYAKMLECPVLRALERRSGDCPSISAVDMNVDLAQ